MLSSYKKYKDNLAKPPKTKGPKKGTRKSFPERFAYKSSALMTSVTDTLAKLDVSARKDLISRIEEMKKAADKLISQIKAAKVVKPAPKKEVKKKPAPKTKKKTETKKKSKGKTASKSTKKK